MAHRIRPPAQWRRRGERGRQNSKPAAHYRGVDFGHSVVAMRSRASTCIRWRCEHPLPIIEVRGSSRPSAFGIFSENFEAPAFGTSRHFTAMQHSGRFRGEADMHRQAKRLNRSKMTHNGNQEPDGRVRRCWHEDTNEGRRRPDARSVVKELVDAGGPSAADWTWLLCLPQPDLAHRVVRTFAQYDISTRARRQNILSEIYQVDLAPYPVCNLACLRSCKLSIMMEV
jgi:hypothetical protein